MTTTTTEEMAILREAAEALREHERRRQELKVSEEALRVLCRRYGDVVRLWGVSPVHLRRACEARGLMVEEQINV